MAGEWREIRVGDLVNRGALAISDGYRVRNEELGTEGIPFVRGGDIGDGWINTDTEDHIRPELADRVRAKLTQAGDAAFITKGTVGRAGRLRPEQPPVVFAPQVAYWRVIDRSVLDPGFVFYLMQSHEFQAALDGVKTHGAMAADYVSISQQQDFRFRFPDIESQRDIAHILGTLDDKIELNRRMNETLEAMARAVFKSWFVDFGPVRAKAEGRDPGLPRALADLFPDSIVDSELGEIPEGWTARSLGQVCARIIEKVEDPRDWREAPLIDLSRMPRKSVALTDWGTGEELTTSVTRFRVRDTLFGAIRPYFHKVGLAPVDGVTSVSIIVLRPQVANDWPYVVLLASSPDAVEYATRVAQGTKMPVVSWSDLMKHKSPTPSAELRAAFGHVVESVLNRVLTGIHESRTLAALRDALLPKLLSGELRVLDAKRYVREVAT